jgi:hypothetical protein
MIKTFFTILLNLILATNTLFAQQAKEETVYFNYNKYDLTENAKKILNRNCEKINDKLLLQITLTGHTDADGSNEYNLTLSKNRTNAVLDYFISHGISKDKIKIYFLGEDRPIAQNDNEQGKQQNRRVEIIIKSKEPVLGDIFNKLNKESQTFNVIAKENITIKGEEGTVISISKGSLVKDNGEIVNGAIKIELKEFYTKSDIVSSNLHTMSDSKILETAGMINISVTSSGEKLKLKKGTKIEIEFASKNRIKGMETFIGEKHNNQVNWIQQSNPLRVVSVTKGKDNAVIEEDFYEGYGNDSVTMKELNKVDKLILKSGKLGWINCDRFYIFENKTDLIVELDTTYRPVIRLVFKDINAIMPGNYLKDNKFILNAIPVGQKATLITFSFINDEPYFISKDIVITKDQTEILELFKTTMTTLKKDLQKLN